MPTTDIEAIVHPVRLRILMDVAGRERTPYEIRKALPDVSQASLYRHINRLCQAGILKIVRETPVRGATEKVYALADTTAADIHREEFLEISRADHLRYFTSFLSSQLAQFRLYLNQEHFDLNADNVGYRTEALNLTPEQQKAFYNELRDLLTQARETPETAESRRLLVSTIIMPATETKENRQD